MTKTAAMTSEDVLLGVCICAAPRCQISLRPSQGKTTDVGGLPIKTCYQRDCVDWVTDRAKHAGVRS